MAKEKVLYRAYAILYKKPTEACVPYPIAHYLTIEGQQPDTIIDDMPKVKGFPRYKTYWLKLGAPVRQISYSIEVPDDPTKHDIVPTPAQPILYLREVAPTKAETRTRVKGATKSLASYFVNHHLDRAWTPADNGGMHMAHAKKILDLGYEEERVIDCLQALARGDLTDGIPWVAYTQYHNFNKPGWSTLLCVLWGEPPAIEREPNVSALGTALKMTPEEWDAWRKQRTSESLILDETEEVTAARDFSKAPVWAKGK